MQSDALMYSLLGLILALAGFGYYAIEVWKAYKDEKKRIEGDFQLSEKYAPEKALHRVLIFLQMGSTSTLYVLLSIILVYVSGSDSYPNSTLLASQFVFIMGITSLISSISRIPIAKEGVRDTVYVPAIDVPDEIKNIENLSERLEKETEFYEKAGLRNWRKSFGKYSIFMALGDTWNIFSLLAFVLVLIGTELLGNEGSTPVEVSKELANTIFFAGLLYSILTITTIFSMKKSTEIPIENFGERLKVASRGYAIPLIAFLFLIYTMLPLISS